MFKNATMLNAPFLEQHFNYATGMKPAAEGAKFEDYYINICALVGEVYYLKPTPAQIEEYMNNGRIDFGGGEVLTCRIKDATERKYLFRAAQAKQLMYDDKAGRGAMMRGEDAKFNVCADALTRLDMLGLVQRTFTTK